MEKIHSFCLNELTKKPTAAVLIMQHITLNCLSVAQNGLFSSTASSVVNLLNT